MTQDRRNVGKYAVQAFLGEGGMGAVYRGYDESLDRYVAIKELKTDGLDRARDIQRFCNEARIQATLHHPNIATLYEFLEAGGQPYIVMEYVDGQTLLERLRLSGRLAVGEVLDIFRAVALAVNHLHAHGIIHRDLKPNNIKINAAGQVKLLDFGIAKQESAHRLTTTGKVSGTFNRLSPEQWQYGASDHRTDIWQLGTILYEMATGAPPFEAETPDQLRLKIVKSSYLPPSVLNPAVPRQMDEIISRCLKKDPAQRYQSTQQLLDEVDRLLSPPRLLPTRSVTREVVVRIFQKVQEVIRQPSPSLPIESQATSGPPGTRRLKLLLALAVVVVVGGIVWWGVSFRFPWAVTDGMVRTPLHCSLNDVKVFKLVSPKDSEEKWQLIGICGHDDLYVDAQPGEMVTIQLMKNEVGVKLEPFEAGRKPEIPLIADPNIFVKEE